jgi:hypothetical protein
LDFASADCSFVAGRRLRAKLIGLTGTMSAAPSQDSALPFFAEAGGCDWQIDADVRSNSKIIATMDRKRLEYFIVNIIHLLVFDA